MKRRLTWFSRLAGPLPKLRDDYQRFMVSRVVPAELSFGWPGHKRALEFLQKQAITHSEPSVRSIAIQNVAHSWSNIPGTFEFRRQYELM